MLFKTKEEYLKVVSELKQEYKVLSKEIREGKKEVKEYQREHCGDLPFRYNNSEGISYGTVEENSRIARNINVFYGILKGKKYSEIENKTREDRVFNPYRLEKYCKKYGISYDEILKAFENV